MEVIASRLFLRFAMLLLVCFLGVNSGSSGDVWSSTINSMLKTRNKQLVSLSSPVSEAVARGVQMAMEFCQREFHSERWNCPESAFSRHALQPLNREAAYVLAVTAAGVMHSLVKNCSRGDIPGCGCDPNLTGWHEGGWLWGSCSDHLDFAERAAAEFLSSLNSGMDLHAYVSKRNMETGILVLRSEMSRACACSGLSGTCSLKTCWMQLAPFEVIAGKLHQSYKKAKKIGFEPGVGVLSTGNAVASNMARAVPDTPVHRLLFLEDSPDYCVANTSSGWPGVKGRVCAVVARSDEAGGAGNEGLRKAETSARRQCRRLCRPCGRRVKARVEHVRVRCRCAFHWCCSVTCDTCLVEEKAFYCK